MQQTWEKLQVKKKNQSLSGSKGEERACIVSLNYQACIEGRMEQQQQSLTWERHKRRDEGPLLSPLNLAITSKNSMEFS